MVEVHNLIAAISPDVYCDSSVKSEVKKIAKSAGFAAAAKKAKPVDSEHFDIEDAEYKNPFSTPGLKEPVERHNLIYDADSNALEPTYFWILDFINSMYKKSEKLVDSFVSSPGSAHFSEMGTRGKVMQDEAMKMLGAINQVIKSILNMTYDLREFKQRLQLYKDLKSENKDEKQGAMIALKQVWMDTVDMKRGNGSINAMSQQLDFVTLRDAFIASGTVKEAQDLDLNERVKRIVLARLKEYNDWLKFSEDELVRRFNIEKAYLRSQVSTVQLYSRWMSPYLKAAIALEQRASPTSSLVTAFNTALFDLVLIGEGDYNPEDDVNSGELPKVFTKLSKKGDLRKYKPIIIVEFNFRSIPERLGQQAGYGFRGKAEVTFTSYALSEKEIEVLKKEIEKSDIEDAMKYITGITEDSLEAVKKDLDEFLDDKNPGDSKESKKEKKKENNSPGPFSALFGLGKKKEKTGLEPDTDMEKVVRSQAIIGSRESCRKVYDTFKKAHAMPAFKD